LLIGPEAGFTPDEVELMVSAGAIAAEFGPHIMRIETAAVAAAAIVLNAERSSKTGSTVPPHTGC
jgi:16S rRNA (uracil1498-N3)-methyltransferase